MVVGCLGVLDGVVEDVAVAMLRYLRMKHADDVLKAFESYLFLCSHGMAGSAGA